MVSQLKNAPNLLKETRMMVPTLWYSHWHQYQSWRSQRWYSNQQREISEAIWEINLSITYTSKHFLCCKHGKSIYALSVWRTSWSFVSYYSLLEEVIGKETLIQEKWRKMKHIQTLTGQVWLKTEDLLLDIVHSFGVTLLPGKVINKRKSVVAR